MTEAQAIEAIFERWVTQWTSLHPSDVPYTFDNDAFEAVNKWARVAVVTSTRVQSTLGPPGVRRFETRGYIAVQLFGEVNKGAHELAALADDVRTIFESQLIPVIGAENITTYGSPTRPIATDGRWTMSIVMVPFCYYETR